MTGVVHLGQIQSGLRGAMRIAQVGNQGIMWPQETQQRSRISECKLFCEELVVKCKFLFQGGHIKINLKSEIPVQVDGEPWVAAPSEVVVLKSALKVSPLHFNVCMCSFVCANISILESYP